MKPLYILFALAPSVAVAAQDSCLGLINLARETREFAQNSSDFQRNVKDFCSDYYNSKKNGQNFSANAKYKFIEGSASGGSYNAEEVANKYCDKSDGIKNQDEAYKSYIQSIAPGAFQAYESCIRLSQESGVTIELRPENQLENYLSAWVSFGTSDSKTYQDIQFSTSPDVSCKWKAPLKEKLDTTRISVGGSTVIECERKQSTKDSTITIFPNTSSKSSLSFRWTAFEMGLPVNKIEALKASVEKSIKESETIKNSLRNSVIGFNAQQCPPGWAEYAPAAGRFLRGIDNSGSIDPEGIRKAGSLQADDFKSHAHERPQAVYDAGRIMAGSVNPSNPGLGYTYDGIQKAPPTGYTGGQETRPKNVAVKFCTLQK